MPHYEKSEYKVHEPFEGGRRKSGEIELQRGGLDILTQT